MNKYITLAIIAGVFVTVILVIALGGGGGSNVGDRVRENPRDPMTGKTEFNIPVQDPALVTEGEILYKSACAACHGTDLRGTAVGPSHLSVIYNPEHHGDGAFASAIVNGVEAHHWEFGDMPAIANITEEDFTRIMAYIREMQRTEGFEAYPPR